MTARVEWLDVVGDPSVWQSLGFVVADGRVPLFGTSLRLVPPSIERPAGITGWALSGIGSTATDIDGLPTSAVDRGDPLFADHPLGAVGLDHVVVLTSSIERTAATIERVTASPLKRVREVGSMRQGFHRIGSGGLIVELVERPEVTSSVAEFWGLVVNVDDLDHACALLGADLGVAQDAVQPGRRIATVRAGAGLGLPLALMTP